LLVAYLLRGDGILLLEGKVVLVFGCPAIEVQSIGRVRLRAGPRRVIDVLKSTNTGGYAFLWLYPGK